MTVTCNPSAIAITCLNLSFYGWTPLTKTLGSTLIRYGCNTKVSDWCRSAGLWYLGNVLAWVGELMSCFVRNYGIYKCYYYIVESEQTYIFDDDIERHRRWLVNIQYLTALFMMNQLEIAPHTVLSSVCTTQLPALLVGSVYVSLYHTEIMGPCNVRILDYDIMF